MSPEPLGPVTSGPRLSLHRMATPTGLATDRRLYILTLTFYRWETQAQRDRAARAKEGTLGWEEAEIWDLGRMAMYSLMTLGK